MHQRSTADIATSPPNSGSTGTSDADQPATPAASPNDAPVAASTAPHQRGSREPHRRQPPADTAQGSAADPAGPSGSPQSRHRAGQRPSSCLPGTRPSSTGTTTRHPIHRRTAWLTAGPTTHTPSAAAPSASARGDPADAGYCVATEATRGVALAQRTEDRKLIRRPRWAASSPTAGPRPATAPPALPTVDCTAARASGLMAAR